MRAVENHLCAENIAGATVSAHRWCGVCPYDRLLPERGVAALFGDVQVAIFRLHDGTVHAVGNVDPFSGAAVMSRGIVGDRGGVPTVASPIYQDVFALADGTCLDRPEVCLPSYPVRVEHGQVEVGIPW